MSVETVATAVTTDDEGYLIDPAAWTPAVAERIAHDEGIALTDDHRRVIGFIREYHEEHRVAPGVRFVIKFVERELGRGAAARNDLFRMFPYGYVRQACKIAGMRQPRAWSTG